MADLSISLQRMCESCLVTCINIHEEEEARASYVNYESALNIFMPRKKKNGSAVSFFMKKAPIWRSEIFFMCV